MSDVVLRIHKNDVPLIPSDRSIDQYSEDGIYLNKIIYWKDYNNSSSDYKGALAQKSRKNPNIGWLRDILRCPARSVVQRRQAVHDALSAALNKLSGDCDYNITPDLRSKLLDTKLKHDISVRDLSELLHDINSQVSSHPDRSGCQYLPDAVWQRFVQETADNIDINFQNISDKSERNKSITAKIKQALTNFCKNPRVLVDNISNSSAPHYLKAFGATVILGSLIAGVATSMPLLAAGLIAGAGISYFGFAASKNDSEATHEADTASARQQTIAFQNSIVNSWGAILKESFADQDVKARYALLMVSSGRAFCRDLIDHLYEKHGIQDSVQLRCALKECFDEVTAKLSAVKEEGTNGLVVNRVQYERGKKISSTDEYEYYQFKKSNIIYQGLEAANSFSAPENIIVKTIKNASDRVVSNRYKNEKLFRQSEYFENIKSAEMSDSRITTDYIATYKRNDGRIGVVFTDNKDHEAVQSVFSRIHLMQTSNVKSDRKVSDVRQIILQDIDKTLTEMQANGLPIEHIRWNDIWVDKNGRAQINAAFADLETVQPIAQPIKLKDLGSLALQGVLSETISPADLVVQYKKEITSPVFSEPEKTLRSSIRKYINNKNEYEIRIDRKVEEKKQEELKQAIEVKNKQKKISELYAETQRQKLLKNRKAAIERTKELDKLSAKKAKSLAVAKAEANNLKVVQLRRIRPEEEAALLSADPSAQIVYLRA